jgi:tetratricopeptide (TPR) repeat protein
MTPKKITTSFAKKRRVLLISSDPLSHSQPIDQEKWVSLEGDKVTPIVENKETAKIHFDQSYEYWEKSNYEEALVACDKAIEYAPGWSEAYNLRGVILDDLGKPGRSILAYRQAVNLDPDNEIARENLAELEKISSQQKSSLGFQSNLFRKNNQHNKDIKANTIYQITNQHKDVEPTIKRNFLQGSVNEGGDGHTLRLLQLSATPVFKNNPTSSDDDQLNKQARSLMQNHCWVEAERIAQDGLKTCMRKDRLCEVIGDICLEKNNPDAIGWYMQACLINSHSWEPYLLVSYAARAMGLDALAWRCLNACDTIRIGLRIPELEVLISKLVWYSSKSDDGSDLLTAMQSFEKAMDPYLPSADEFPHDMEKRGIFLRQALDYDPDLPPVKQLLRLFSRVS